MIKSTTTKESNYFEIDTHEIYYETQGKGEPLILLHGYTQSSIAWQSYVEKYSDKYKVYLIDLRGHGKSSPFNNTFSVKSASEDVLKLIEHLGIRKIKGIGLSFGGDVLLQMSCLKPKLIHSMIIIGANGDWNSQDFPDMLDTFNYENVEKFQWIYDYHAGGDEQVKKVLDELANYKIKLTNEELLQVETKTLIVLGDKAEQISIESVVLLHKTLKNSQLWIVHNMGHYAHDDDNKNEFLRLSKQFLSFN